MLIPIESEPDDKYLTLTSYSTPIFSDVMDLLTNIV